MSGRKTSWDNEVVGAGTKTKKRGKKAAVEPDLDLDALGLDLEMDNSDDVPEEEEKPKKKPTKKAAKKAKKKVAKKKAKKSEAVDDLDLGLADDEVTERAELPTTSEEVDAVEAAAARLGIDLSMECPVCRSLDPCECEEEDRTFVRRTRFEEDVKKVARCPRCGAPLSVVYLPRPGLTPPPLRLSQFEGVWACSCCQTHALATLVLGVQR